MARRISVFTLLLTTLALLFTMVAAGTVSADKKDKKPPKKEGGEGCTPGYWRQSQHFGNWTSPYDPTDDFDATFGVTFFNPDITLLQAVWLGGGGKNALARHAVAALLNAASADVDYDLTVAQVKAVVQAAGSSGDYEGAKNILAALNEQGCDLARAEAA